MKLVKNENQKDINNKISEKEAEEAFIKIIQWMGEDPTREGLRATPKRIADVFVNFMGENYFLRRIIFVMAVTFSAAPGSP